LAASLRAAFRLVFVQKFRHASLRAFKLDYTRAVFILSFFRLFLEFRVWLLSVGAEARYRANGDYIVGEFPLADEVGEKRSSVKAVDECEG
jgi:hypothetical protein